MTTLKISGGDLGRECMYVRCDLQRGESPIEVCYDVAEGWTHTQYQCADARHSRRGLIAIGRELAARAVEMVYDAAFACDVTDV